MARVSSDLATAPVPTTVGDGADPDTSPKPKAGTGDRPSLSERLYPPMPADRHLLGWIGPLLVTALAAVLRFRHLGYPKALVFDETYYAKDAWTLLHWGAERSWPQSADAGVLSGTPAPDPSKAEFVVHPPVGKWLIGAGEQLFGLNPFGWRFMVAVLGTLSVLMLARIARRLTRSTLLGCAAGLLLALDGLHFVMSRTALLDIILMFFVLAAFGALAIDRDRTRAKLAAFVQRRPPGPTPQPGPRLGLRPWRIVAGLCLGLATGTKWNGLYFIVAFGLMTFCWDVGARRALGVRRPARAALRRDAVPGFLSVAALAVVTYVASWTGWLLRPGGWDRTWAPARPGVLGAITRAARGLWHYHSEILYFHTHLHAFHPYKSSPWSWLVIGRPVSYYYQTVGSGHVDCAAKQCAQETLAMGTPVLWWAALIALPFMIWRAVAHRDWRFGAALCGVVAGYLPWFAFTDRTIFYFYSVAFLPFLVLGLVLTLGVLLGPAQATRRRRAVGASVAGLVVVLVAVNFLYLLPVLRADTIPMAAWQARMWFPSWI